jgi:hypothetical protein
MRVWQREIAVIDAQLRLRYYERLVSYAGLSPALARQHAEESTIEEIRIYIQEN